MPVMDGAKRGGGWHAPRARWRCLLCDARGPGGAVALQEHLDESHRREQAGAAT